MDPITMGGILAILLSAGAVYPLVTYFRDPYGLRRFPGPFLAKFSYAWVLCVGLTRRRATIIHEMHKRYGPIVRVSPHELSFSDPAAYAIVHSFNTRLPKSSFYQAFATIGLTNVFTSQSKSEHGQKRRLLHPLFTAQVSREFAPKTAELMNTLLGQWETRYTSNDAEYTWFDCVPWVTLLSFDQVSSFVFGDAFGMVSSSSDDVKVSADWRAALYNTQTASSKESQAENASLTDLVTEREAYNYLAGLAPAWLKSFARKVLWKQVRSSLVFSGFVAQKVYARLGAAISDPEEPTDLVGRFLKRTQSQKETFRAETLIAELITIVVAGSDTSRNTLIAAIYYLAQHPNLQRQLHEELDARLGPEYDSLDVEDLPFLGAVLNETLRMHSPVGIGLPRTVTEPGLTVCGEFIAAGTTVGVPIYTIHRDHGIWGSDASEFRPDRWLEAEDTTAKYSDAFKPFSDGPAGCIGKTLALLQLRVMIAAVFTKFEVVLEDPRSELKTEDWFVRRVTECRIGVRRRSAPASVKKA
ncbi:unnamed protein product [Mycena citricolor]|uniref:Cytochrome P450 n=1 Tax=Mycena citricolor TaxID=2018698 RepID=A0AAD2H3U1_9AGAR|nr:unnamed protein product [Mycena citricolor]